MYPISLNPSEGLGWPPFTRQIINKSQSLSRQTNTQHLAVRKTRSQQRKLIIGKLEPDSKYLINLWSGNEISFSSSEILWQFRSRKNIKKNVTIQIIILFKTQRRGFVRILNQLVECLSEILIRTDHRWPIEFSLEWNLNRKLFN